MKRILIGLIAAAALPAFAVQAANKAEHPPEKAMDEGTPDKKGGSDGASSGSSGAAEVESWDIRKAGEGVTLNSKSQAK